MTAIRRIVVTPPNVEPVSIEEAKFQLRIKGSQFDAELPGMLAAAREAAENYCNRYWSKTVVDVVFDRFPSGSLYIPLRAVISVDDVSYLADDESTTVTGYAYDATRQRLSHPAGWPVNGASPVVRVTAGPDIAAGGFVPHAVKAAILMMLSDLFEHRAAQSAVNLYSNPTAIGLLTPYREEMGI
jgi:uncharacterized phiE125 gp8 family phage protein